MASAMDPVIQDWVAFLKKAEIPTQLQLPFANAFKANHISVTMLELKCKISKLIEVKKFVKEVLDSIKTDAGENLSILQSVKDLMSSAIVNQAKHIDKSQPKTSTADNSGIDQLQIDVNRLGLERNHLPTIREVLNWRPNLYLFLQRTKKQNYKNNNPTKSRATKKPYILVQEETGAKKKYITKLERWHNFDKEIYDFESNIAQQSTQASLGCVPNFLQRLVNQATAQLYASVVLMHTVEKMVPPDPDFKLHQFVCNYRVQGSVIPDLFFSVVSNRTYLPEIGLVPIEIKPPHDYYLDETIVKVYNQDDDNKKTGSIRQAINYMLKTNTKYSILTTFEQTWVFKREEERVFVSETVNPVLWLRTIFWVCCKALEDAKSCPQNAYQFSPADFDDHDCIDDNQDKDGDQDDDDVGNRSNDSVQRSLPGKCRERVECVYRKEYDTYDQDDEDESIYYTSKFKKIGSGRIGAFYADMYKDGTFLRPVALKCTDEDKCRGEVKELRNEGRVLYYAKKLGLKCTPEIYFSGSSGANFINLIQLLSKEEFYTKKLKKLDLQEQQLFRAALIELASNGIRHNDIRSRHVYFARDRSRCVIIDYGFAKLVKNKNELELEYEFDESLSQSPAFQQQSDNAMAESLLQHVIDTPEAFKTTSTSTHEAT